MKRTAIFTGGIILSFLFPGMMRAQCDTILLKRNLHQIIDSTGARDYLNVDGLNRVSGYIYSEFGKFADTTFFQPYQAYGNTYRNVVAVFGDTSKPIIVIGAHYDVCGEQDGADDNASGVAGLLELARLMDTVRVNRCIQLVAYTLEEPPAFRTHSMGSYVHAQSLKESNKIVEGMISLEMIGYFDDAKNSQHYPIGLLKLFYGGRGNFITLVSTPAPGKFVKHISHEFRKSGSVKTKKFRAPAALPGIDFSDHLNYWAFDYPAFMITDTAFFRNVAYHTNKDTMDRLDLKRMAAVIDALYFSLNQY